MRDEKENKFDPEEKLKELLPNSFDSKGNYIPIYTPSSNEPANAVTVEAASKEFDNLDPRLVGVGTGLLGAVAGRNVERVTSRLAPPLPQRVQAPPSTVAPPTAASAPIDPKTGMPYSGDKWSNKVVGSMGPGGNSVTEAARNYQIQQSLSPTESAQFKTGREGIILPNKVEVEQRLMQEAKQKAIAERAKRAMQTVGKGTQVATHMFPRLMTGLGAFGAGAEGTEAVNRYRQGDYPGAAISGMGALGSASSMMPHPLTRGVGTAAGVLSPLMLQGYDYLRNKE
jgi:hypothetical protein